MEEEALDMLEASPVEEPPSLFSTESSIVPYQTPQNPTTNQEREEEERKIQQHNKKQRSKNWTRVETLKLIKLRTELDPRFARGGRKTEIWDEIADALKKDSFFRDGQQCRDKWEKLMAGFKDVRDGLKEPSDNLYYNDLFPLLASKCLPSNTKERGFTFSARKENNEGGFPFSARKENNQGGLEDGDAKVLNGENENEGSCLRKRKRYVPVTDIEAVKALLEVVITRQQMFFKELLESLERKEQIREQMRLEREERWRAEERAHRNVFNNAMVALAHRVLGEKAPDIVGLGCNLGSGIGASGVVQPKKRSKNWKRGEVLQLIKLRGEMEVKFANSSRRAVLWEELAEMLAKQGIKRDGKQCREKWDKLMASYKDVVDGKREEGDLSYFAELKGIIGGRVEDSKPQPDVVH